MKLGKLKIEAPVVTPFQTYLLTSNKVKRMAQEFLFYNVLFYNEEKTSSSIVYLQYPYGNLYWYIEFARYIKKEILPDKIHKVEWLKLLKDLKKAIESDFVNLKKELDGIGAKDVLDMELKHKLRDYQAYDLIQLLIKYKHWDKTGLILSEQRTGKTRVALAMLVETMNGGDVAVIVCPKSAVAGWISEIYKYDRGEEAHFNTTIISKRKDVLAICKDGYAINIRLISYDLFKTLNDTELRYLTSKCKHITLLGDEIHRLRNFKTQQSKAMFNFKDFAKKEHIDLGIIGISGTPSVKESSDVFGVLSLINNSKICFKPTYTSFNLFKEYFYICEDTSFGKITKALKREQELNFIIQNVAVQTKQKELSFFKNYQKEYKRVDLDMDVEQRKIYESVYSSMEYDEDIDCQNKLVQLTRLQQICIDPSGLVNSYDLTSPKLKWIVGFALKNKDFRFIVSCKQLKPLKHLVELFDKYGIKSVSLNGSLSNVERVKIINDFEKDDTYQVICLQQDTGRESLTLPSAKAIVFLNRDYTVGFNEQAEARMTPIDGASCKKLVIDLVMNDSKEEEIYNKLVTRKESINAINLVFKPRKEV